jgi:hypothetical protein
VAGIGIALVIVAGVAVATGVRTPIFTASEPGVAARDAPQPAAPTTTSTPPTLPPRPGALPLAGVRPCTLLTESQRLDLGLDGPPTPYTDPEFDHAHACTIRGRDSGTVARLAPVLDMGADVWLSDEAQVLAAPVRVAGWPALEVRTPGLRTVCDVEVDTGPDQFLDVQLRDGGNATPVPQDALCRGARRVASAAVVSLRATG